MCDYGVVLTPAPLQARAQWESAVEDASTGEKNMSETPLMLRELMPKKLGTQLPARRCYGGNFYPRPRRPAIVTAGSGASG